MELPETKVCTRCGETKARDEYYRSQYSRTGLYSHCKNCHRALLRTKRKRVAEEKAMARQPHPPTATEPVAPLGLLAHVPKRKIKLRRVVALFAQAFTRTGVSPALMAWGAQRPFALTRYLQRFSGVVIMTIACFNIVCKDDGDRSKHQLRVLDTTVKHVLQVTPWRSLPNTLPSVYANRMPRLVRQQHRPVTTGVTTAPRSPVRVHVHPMRPTPLTMLNTVVAPPSPQDNGLLQLLMSQQQTPQRQHTPVPLPTFNGVNNLAASDPQALVMQLLKTVAPPTIAPPSPLTNPNSLSCILATLLQQPQQPTPMQTPMQQMAAALVQGIPAAPSPAPNDTILQQLLSAMQEQTQPPPQLQQPSIETLLRMLQGQP